MISTNRSQFKKLLTEAYESAKKILSTLRDQMQPVAQERLRRETLDEPACKALPVSRALAAPIDNAIIQRTPGTARPIQMRFRT